MHNLFLNASAHIYKKQFNLFSKVNVYKPHGTQIYLSRIIMFVGLGLAYKELESHGSSLSCRKKFGNENETIPKISECKCLTTFVFTFFYVFFVREFICLYDFVKRAFILKFSFIIPKLCNQFSILHCTFNILYAL